jgi:hypothetical protein
MQNGNESTCFTLPTTVTRTPDGKVTTIVTSPNHSDEPTGLRFPPDGTFMYFAYQDEGILIEVKRQDVLPFYVHVLDVSELEGHVGCGLYRSATDHV